jgi:hypothetical protein
MQSDLFGVALFPFVVLSIFIHVPLIFEVLIKLIISIIAVCGS